MSWSADNTTDSTLEAIFGSRPTDIDLHADSRPGNDAVVVILLLVATLALVLRFAARFVAKAGVEWDDGLMVLALVCKSTYLGTGYFCRLGQTEALLTATCIDIDVCYLRGWGFSDMSDGRRGVWRRNPRVDVDGPRSHQDVYGSLFPRPRPLKSERPSLAKRSGVKRTGNQS